MPVDDARAILGARFIIGGTANTFGELQELAAAGVDYIGLGPLRFTITKEKLSPILGFAGYETLLSQCHELGLRVPIIGIGGVTLSDVPGLLATGLHGVAVSGAISMAPEPSVAAAAFLERLQQPIPTAS